MTNEELIALLQKAGIDTSTGGLLPPEASNRFIDTTVQQSEFLTLINVERNIGTSRYLDTIGVEKRLMYKAAESTEPTTIRGITAGRRALTPAETILPYDISMRWLEENIARDQAEDQVNQAFGKQFSTDLADLGFNGDTDDETDDKDFLNITDGIIKRLGDDENVHEVDRASSTDWKGAVFPKLVKAMPSKYKADPSALRLLVSFDTEDEYRQQLADRATALGDVFLTEKRRAQYKGIEVMPVPNVPTTFCLLTNPKNVSMGIGREISVFRMFVPRKRILEYTITAKVDFNYAVSDIMVFCS